MRKAVKYRSKSAHTCSFLDVKSTIIIAPRIPDKQARRSIQSQRVIGKRRDEVSVIRKTRDEVSERVKNKTARHSKHYLEGRKSNQRKPTCNYNVIPSKWGHYARTGSEENITQPHNRHHHAKKSAARGQERLIVLFFSLSCVDEWFSGGLVPGNSRECKGIVLLDLRLKDISLRHEHLFLANLVRLQNNLIVSVHGWSMCPSTGATSIRGACPGSFWRNIKIHSTVK